MMITKKKKREKTWPTILFSALFAFFILIIVGFLIFSNWKTNQKRAELTLRIESLKKEIEILEQKKQELEFLASESGKADYLETVAREQLNLKKPGEEVVTILSPEKEKEEEVQAKKGFWQRILEKVGF